MPDVPQVDVGVGGVDDDGGQQARQQQEPGTELEPLPLGGAPSVGTRESSLPAGLPTGSFADAPTDAPIGFPTDAPNRFPYWFPYRFPCGLPYP